MGNMIEFACPNGGTAAGYLAEATDARGGVVVIQEWWGLNPQIKGVADRFAAAGYTAIAPDLYEGRVTQEPDEANHMMTGLDWVGATEQDVRGAVQHLKSLGVGKTAVMGFCMGGALTVIAGAKLPECDAAVCYYGIPPKEAADPAAVRVPFLGHFATEDDWCTPEAVAGLRRDMANLSTPVEIHDYQGAAHGFFNEAASYHDKASSDTSWARTLAFMGSHIG